MSSSPPGADATTTEEPEESAMASSSPSLQLASYWCHVCHSRVDPLSSSPLICPHCGCGFLESTPPPSPSPSPSRSPLSDASTASSSSCGPSPAPRSAIDSLPTVSISDPFVPCAVCKDDFSPGSAASQLPCSHLYHPDCITPWLSRRNSCPLCRRRLPRPSLLSHRTARLSNVDDYRRLLMPEEIRAILIDSVRESIRSVLERPAPTTPPRMQGRRVRGRSSRGGR